MPSISSLKWVAAAAVALLAANLQAAPVVGLTAANQLVRFDSQTPASSSATAITGLAAGDRLVGIDLRPTNNTLYGVTLSNKIYTLNELTGAATFVVDLDTPVINSGLAYGIDFNPAADYSGGSSLRLISSAGANFAINVGTGIVGNQASNIGTGYSAVAYSNSSTQGPPASTALYYINSDSDSLSVASSAFNSPTILPVGGLGLDALELNGFELLANGTALAALQVAGGNPGLTGIYSINLATGAASLIGEFDGQLQGLSLSAVPEPGSLGLAALALAALAWPRRSRHRWLSIKG